eukprot:8049455-Alexandrium_andersonii.AAC.1
MADSSHGEDFPPNEGLSGPSRSRLPTEAVPRAKMLLTSGAHGSCAPSCQPGNSCPWCGTLWDMDAGGPG